MLIDAATYQAVFLNAKFRQWAALFFTVIFLNDEVLGQNLQDTLHEVQVKGKKEAHQSADIRIKDFTPGQKITGVDSALLQQYKMQSAAQLLAQQTPVFIRSYGFNGLATLNFRGSSAAQSQVYWNGIPITNASLGIADVSLLPVAFITNMNIVYGGAAALLGSGNVGGALMIETEQPRFDSLPRVDAELGFGFGSFSQRQAAGEMGYRNKKWFGSVAFTGQTAKNDFAFIKGGKETRTENSELKGGSVMAQLGYKLNWKNIIRTIGWYQEYDRNIPPALFESYSVKNRVDASLKLLTDWVNHTAHSQRYVRTAFISDRMRYKDTTAKLFTSNQSYQYYLEAGWKQSLSLRHKLLLFVPVHISQMKRTASMATQQKYALATAYNYRDLQDKLDLSLNARAEVINKTFVFLPGINASYQWRDWIRLRANVQRTYRMPSLNELYFEPGGNKDLKPEQGWAQDAGYVIALQPSQRFSIHHDLAVYHRLINDWIVWYGGAIWTPHNIARVRSSGMEMEFLFKYALKKIVFHLGLKGNYTRAVTVSSYVAGDGSIGKQIPYTPELGGLANMGFTYRSFYLNYNHTYTGLRYFNTDETGLLDRYHIANIQLSKDLLWRKVIFQASLLLNNIYAQKYIVVASRPMPGRHVSVSLTLRKK